MTFGFATLIDLLSWVVVLSLGLKIVVTLILVIVDREARDRPGLGSALWWATKITPIIAVPCVAWIALLEGQPGLAWVFLATGLFVVVAVPLKIRQRRSRIAKHPPVKPQARLH